MTFLKRLFSSTAILLLLLSCDVLGAVGSKAEANLGLSERQRGRELFEQICSKCHGTEGGGRLFVAPPLAGSDFLMSDKARSIRIVAEGLKGPIIVNGKRYNGTMPKQKLREDQIAEVLTYVRASFGNPGGEISPAEVSAVLRGEMR